MKLVTGINHSNIYQMLTFLGNYSYNLFVVNIKTNNYGVRNVGLVHSRNALKLPPFLTTDMPF